MDKNTPTPRRSVRVSDGYWLTLDHDGTINLGGHAQDVAHGPTISRAEAEEWADADRADWMPTSAREIGRAAQWMQTAASQTDVIALCKAFALLLAE